MSKKRSNKISTLGSQISTVISVSLVLVIVGMILIITSLTSGASDALRQRVAIVVSLMPDASADDISRLSTKLKAEPYASSVVFTSADDVLRQEMQYNSDILEALGQNPYSAEFEVFLNAAFVDADSIVKISQRLDFDPAVAEVYSQSDLVTNVNNMLRKSTLALSVIGCILLIISVVLLFNTISLVIYSRRFVIRTMQLIGATSAFIRRPFVRAGVLMGLVSALIASLVICALHLYTIKAQIDSLFFVSWPQTLCVCAIIFVVGILLCGIASAMATRRFLHASYDTLYRK